LPPPSVAERKTRPNPGPKFAEFLAQKNAKYPKSQHNREVGKAENLGEASHSEKAQRTNTNEVGDRPHDQQLIPIGNHAANGETKAECVPRETCVVLAGKAPKAQAHEKHRQYSINQPANWSGQQPCPL